jgi:hypothetical protein
MSSQTDSATNTPILPEELRGVLNERGAGPLELLDPASRRTYVLLSREQYDALLRAVPSQAATPGATPQSSISPPAAPSVQGPLKPMRQWLKDLPTPPEVVERATKRRKQLGLIFWKRYWQDKIEEELKLQYYYGGQWVAYLPRKEGLLIVGAGYNLDEIFDQQLACLEPSERREKILIAVDPWNDTRSLIYSYAHIDASPTQTDRPEDR